MTVTRPTYIFDLDHTVIDSSHRKLTLPDGSLDLAHWFENATREKIMQDTLMPLANFWRRIFRTHNVLVCTARTMQAPDWEYLSMHGLHFDAALYRRVGCMKRDADLKVDLITQFCDEVGLSPSGCIMYDDNLSVIEAVRKLGVDVRHPDGYKE